jgi:hypothetical protein
MDRLQQVAQRQRKQLRIIGFALVILGAVLIGFGVSEAANGSPGGQPLFLGAGAAMLGIASIWRARG